MFKRIICILLCCTIFGNIGGFVFAENTIEARNEALAVSTVKEWFLNNYQKFYIVEDAKFELIRYHKKEQSTHYTVSAFCKTQLKFDSVYDLPYVKGMYEEIEKMGLSEKESNEMLQIIDEYTKNSIDFSHDSIPLSIDIVVEIGDERTNKDSITLYYKDGMNTTLYPISVVELDEEELYKDGQDVFKELYKSKKNATNNTKGYYYYNRIDARDYALSYTGQNVTSCYDDGTSCGIMQDRTQWNNSEYYYIDNLKHNDCADFVSQCLEEGGIPVDPGKWERFYDGNNGWSWTSVYGQENYMTSKGYWDSSTFASANAGNIIRWTNQSHVGLITLNDTVTHRFTAHTDDRYNYQFYNSTIYYYYTINTN